MKVFFKNAFLFSLLFYVSASLFAQSNYSIKQFKFMLGDWSMKTKSGRINETWKIDNNKMIGESYRIEKENAAVLTERIELSLIDHVYNFSVTGFEEGNEGTNIFKLVSNQNNTFIFENKTHDFPQRIVYQRKDKNSLLAWIEGSINGKMSRIDFLYERKN